MHTPFFEQIVRRQAEYESHLCVGLDPRPEWFTDEEKASGNPWRTWSLRLLDAVAEEACCVKPNIAFYEAGGLDGLEALRESIAYAHHLGLPVLLDAKRGDIGSTARAYAQACYEWLDADAVTLSPYLGYESIAPFLAYEGRAVFVLCHTSNPTAREIQTLTVEGRPLYEKIALLAAEWGKRVGLVVGATYPDAIASVRHLAPTSWLLLPGIGAQGGDTDAAIQAAQHRFIVPLSRAIATADDPSEAARAWRQRLQNIAQNAPTSSPAPSWHALALALHELGAIQFGEFRLASGQTSPIYIDLRLLVSEPTILAAAARAYAEYLRTLTFDRLAAIPYAGLPIGTAVALAVGRPLIYPRKEAKAYGRQRAIEGTFRQGERVVVIEDLATTGGSALKGIRTLREAGLIIEDVVVLIDREAGAATHLAGEGVRLHAVMGLREMLQFLHEQGRMEAGTYERLLRYLDDTKVS